MDEETLNELFRRDDGRRSPFGVCVDVDDILDGFYVHTEGCPHLGCGYVGGSTCIGPVKRMGYDPTADWMHRKPYTDIRPRCEHGYLGMHAYLHESGKFSLRCQGPVTA